MDTKEFERVLQDRQRSKRLAQSEAASIRKAIDSEGKVRVWNFADKKWRQLWPVDASEQLRLGYVALEVVEMTGPQGTQWVALSEVAERQGQGWKVAGEELSPPSDAAPPQTETDVAQGKRRSDKPAK